MHFFPIFSYHILYVLQKVLIAIEVLKGAPLA